jgi:hypothetical protein
MLIKKKVKGNKNLRQKTDVLSIFHKKLIKKKIVIGRTVTATFSLYNQTN